MTPSAPSPDSPLPFDIYTPGQFADMAVDALASDIWAYVSTTSARAGMLAAVEQGRSPMEAVGHDLHHLFGHRIDSSRHDTERLRTMVNNMVKQLMEYHGYHLIACTLLRDCPFCSSAGLFAKQPPPGQAPA